MIQAIASSILQAATLLLLALNLSEAPAVDIEKWEKHQTAQWVVGAIFVSARNRADNAMCDATLDNGNVRKKAIDFAVDTVKDFYIRITKITLAPTNAMKAAVESVAKNKLCMGNKFVASVKTQFKPKSIEGMNACDPNVKLPNAADEHLDEGKKEKSTTPFKKEAWATLFKTCNCEMESFINAGQAGVVFLVKLKGSNEKRAMKIAGCGDLQPEIYAQEKLKDSPWAIKMDSWGRSSEDKPKWEYYIMELIGSTVQKAVTDGGVDSTQLKEVMRLALEAATDLHTKYGFAHSDLKTDNIAFMHNEPKKIKLIDFGLAAPVTDDNGIAAYNDYWRIFEAINDHNSGVITKTFGRNGATPLFRILNDEAATLILDGNPLSPGANNNNNFPKKTFFNTYLHGKVMKEFVKQGWILESSIGKKDTVLEKLFSNKFPVL